MRDAIFVLLLRWELLQVHYSKINFFSLSNDDLLNKNNDVFVYILKQISLNSQQCLFLLFLCWELLKDIIPKQTFLPQ